MQPASKLCIRDRFRDNAYAKGRRICEKLRDNIPRNLFEIPVQAAIGGKIIARETVKAYLLYASKPIFPPIRLKNRP